MGTLEEIIKIDKVEYEWKLLDASSNLTLYIQDFDPQMIGLTPNFYESVCPEIDENLLNCLRSDADVKLEEVYQSILEYIRTLYEPGYESLKSLLDDSLFDVFVIQPTEDWFGSCKEIMHPTDEVYTETFLTEFNSS